MMDDILLDQCRNPLQGGKICASVQRPTGEMLLCPRAVVNLRVVQYHKQLKGSLFYGDFVPGDVPARA
jgi:hypothetical protein